MRRRGIGLVVAVAVTCAFAPAPAEAGKPRAAKSGKPERFLLDRTARAHYELAGAAAERGDYRVAAAELDAAYAIEPHPELLFVRAEVRRRLDECRAALVLYREFIDSTPSEAARQQAEAGITACEQTLAASEPPPSPPVVEPPPPAPVAEKKPPPKWQRDPAGGVLLGLGVAALAAAAGLGVGAALVAKAAGSTDSQSEHERLAPANVRLLAGTGVAAAVGVGLVVGAALRYRAVARRGRQVSAWFDGRGGGVVVRMHF